MKINRKWFNFQPSDGLVERLGILHADVVEYCLGDHFGRNITAFPPGEESYFVGYEVSSSSIEAELDEVLAGLASDNWQETAKKARGYGYNPEAVLAQAEKAHEALVKK